MIHVLRYGNTRTYYICGGEAGILVDTDWAGTLPAFFRAIKQHHIRVEAIRNGRTLSLSWKRRRCGYPAAKAGAF